MITCFIFLPEDVEAAEDCGRDGRVCCCGIVLTLGAILIRGVGAGCILAGANVVFTELLLLRRTTEPGATEPVCWILIGVLVGLATTGLPMIAVLLVGRVKPLFR